MKRILLLTSIILLAGCQTIKYVPTPVKVEVPEYLLVPCEPLKKLTGLTAEDSYRWKVEAASKHRACLTKDQALIDVIKTYMEK